MGAFTAMISSIRAASTSIKFRNMRIQRLHEKIDWEQVIFRELTAEELQEAYALAKAAFTAEDLQRYTEIHEGVPAEDILAELEEIQKQFEQKQS
jgi:hypothetical protein